VKIVFVIHGGGCKVLTARRAAKDVARAEGLVSTQFRHTKFTLPGESRAPARRGEISINMGRLLKRTPPRKLASSLATLPRESKKLCRYQCAEETNLEHCCQGIDEWLDSRRISVSAVESVLPRG
jgi:hypothetical protein